MSCKIVSENWRYRFLPWFRHLFPEVHLVHIILFWPDYQDWLRLHHFLHLYSLSRSSMVPDPLRTHSCWSETISHPPECGATNNLNFVMQAWACSDSGGCPGQAGHRPAWSRQHPRLSGEFHGSAPGWWAMIDGNARHRPSPQGAGFAALPK